MKRNIPLVYLSLLLLIVSCSTKKNTWSARQYHNLTARYNVYFNANESFKDASKKAESIYPNSFDELLPVFAFAYSDAPNITMSDLDRTNTKANKLITKHSITAKPKRKASPTEAYRKFYNRKEFNNMVDDAYLLMGKSQLYQQQFDAARTTFENIISTYPNQNTITEAKVWLAVLAAHTEDPETAEKQLKDLEAKLKRDKEVIYSRKLRLATSSAWADIYIKQEKYTEAIRKLEEAIKIARQKETKVRYRFILAQLYERTGNNSMATAYYEKIAKMSVPYEVQFSALMNIANTMDGQTQGKELEARYKKMLANENNTEYFDQIYYALGNLAKTQGDTTNAISYYKKSVEASVGNEIQKGLSSLALANHYYYTEDYYPSYTNYVTAAGSLGDHPKKSYADSMTNLLNVVGKNLTIVNREDSLQRIAKMDPSERQAYADKQAKEALQREQEGNTTTYSSGYGYQYNNASSIPGMRAQSDPSSGKWYFYNSSIVSQGQNDFKMRWGQRKLEDNWRRKNKATATISEDDIDEEELEDDELTGEAPKKDIPLTSAEYYLQDVPLTEEAMSASNAKLEKALYNLAFAYRTDLHNNKKSLETFYRLLNEFPQNDNLPSIYYNIYQLLMEDGKYAEAEDVKSKLISQFPQDKLALSLQNPNYLQEITKQEKEAEGKYEEALALYRNNNYVDALGIINSSLQTYKGLSTEPNFALLKILSTAYSNEASYKEDLQSITTKYPNTSASNAAKNILKVLEADKPTTSIDIPKPPKTEGEETGTVEEVTTPPTVVVEEVITADQDYSYNENADHVVLIIINKETVINKLAFNIAVFNAENYINKNYELREELGLDDNNKAIVVSIFKNKKEAMDYYNAITSNPKTLAEESTLCIAISKDNFERLKLKKSIGGYMPFFQQNYLGSEAQPDDE